MAIHNRFESGGWPMTKEFFAEYNLLVCFIGFGVTCLSYLIARELTHAFHQIPGPFLARYTRSYIQLSNWSGTHAERIHEIHEKYGPVVRIGPNELDFADPAAVNQIYSSRNVMKWEGFYGYKKGYSEHHLFSFFNVEAHKSRRKLLSRGFSSASLSEFEPQISQKIAALMGQFSKATANGSTTIDLYPWAHMVGFDIIYTLMFGEDPKSVEAGLPDVIMKYIAAWRPTFIYKEWFPPFEQYGIYFPGTIGRCFRSVYKWKKLSLDVIRSHRSLQTNTPFLSRVLDGEDAYLGRPLTDSELAEECMGGLFGGSGTTANTFIYLVYALFTNENYMRKLQNELVEAFPDKDVNITYLAAKKLPYLEAIINETLRRYPAIIATLPRLVTESFDVNGTYVPKGSIIGGQNYTIHRDPKAFPHPEAFDPNRWFDEERRLFQKQSFMPFSSGARKCIGLNLADIELTLLTANFFRNFTGQVNPSLKMSEMRQYDTFNAGPAGRRLPVIIKPI